MGLGEQLLMPPVSGSRSLAEGGVAPLSEQWARASHGCFCLWRCWLRSLVEPSWVCSVACGRMLLREAWCCLARTAPAQTPALLRDCSFGTASSSGTQHFPQQPDICSQLLPSLRRSLSRPPAAPTIWQLSGLEGWGIALSLGEGTELDSMAFGLQDSASLLFFEL